MIPEDHEITLAKETAAGREALEVLRRVRGRMTNEQRLEKAFELTETTRRFMRAGLKANHPELNEQQIQKLYVDRILSYHGLSFAKIEAMREADRKRQSHGKTGTKPKVQRPNSSD